MFIHRIITKVMLESAKEYPVVALTGPRQSGKTTLVKEAFPQLKYVSLEDPEVLDFALRDPRGFLAQGSQGIILDEVQNAPELFSYIQGIVDDRKMMGQFILTGSQHFLLLEKISQSLAGRVSILSLLPLSLEELVSAGAAIHDSFHLIMNGFYPRLHEVPVHARDWYANYIKTYVERDVRQIKNITDLNSFQRFLRLCAGRAGQLLNLSSVASDSGIIHNTARSWLSVLEASYIIFFLQPHHQNFNKRLVKTPKMYFFDTGLASSLLGIHEIAQLNDHPLRGNLFENFVIAELFKYRTHRGLSLPFYLWRDRTGHEIDCIFDNAGKLIPIEIKSGKTISSDFFKNLAYWNKELISKPI